MNRYLQLITAVLLLLPIAAFAQDLKDVKPGNAGQAVVASTTPSTTATAPGFNERYPRYQVAPGDVMDLNFVFSPEFNQTEVAVQPDGFVSLAGIGDVHVAGLTVPQVTAAVGKAYEKILNNPEIVVKLRNFNEPYFIVGGQVGHPGKYELRAPTTLIEAVEVAGGFTEMSKHSEVWLFHRMPDGTVQSKRVDAKHMLAKGNLNEDVRVQPGDTIYVPQNTFSKLKGFVIPHATIGPTLTPNVGPTKP